MANANALNSLNSVGGKTIACLENFQTFTKAQAVASVALTSTAGSVATDASLSNTFTLTLTENSTLANPTNLVSGTRYTWIITQGASPFTVSLDTTFLATLDTFVMPAGAGDKEVLEAIYDGTNLIYTFDIQASSSFVLQNEVFVAKNGVNAPGGGNVSNPFGDPFYATTQTTGTQANPHVIRISPGIYESTTLSVKPFVSYRGYSVEIDADTSITLDSSWSSAPSGAYATFVGTELIGSVSFDFTAIATSFDIALNSCDVINSFAMSGNDLQVLNSFGSIFGSTVELKCITSFFTACDFSHSDVDPALSVLPKDTGTGATAVDIASCGFLGSILISGASSRVSNVKIKNSSIIGTITLDTTNCNLTIDQASYPQAGFLFTNGATSAQITFTTQLSPEDTVFVTTNGRNTNGNGTFSNPYADPVYANTQTTGTPSNTKLITIYPNEYNTVGFVIKPNITYQGFYYCTTIDPNATITLDSSWSTAAIASVAVIRDLYFMGTMDFDFSSAGVGKAMILQGCNLGGVTFTGASDNIPTILMSTCTINVNLTIESVNFSATNVNFSGSNSDLTIQSSGSGTTSADLSGCYFHSGSDILISGASGSTTSVRIFSSPIRGTLTLDTTFATLTIDAASIPAGGITYTNGALSSQVTVVGNAPAKSFNNAYTAQNYIVPVAQNSSANATAWNLNTAPNATQTMTENTTLSSPTNQIAGATYIFKFVQDSTPRTLAFNSVYKFPGGVVPIVSTGSGAVDIFTFYSDGTNMRCIGIAQNIS